MTVERLTKSNKYESRRRFGSLFGFIYIVQNMVTEGSWTDEKLEMHRLEER